ncbi:MAG: IS607 family transposase [Ktedonobacteraceae bacterium]
MKSTYSPQEFGQLIGRKTKTLQKWDREGKLKAYRSPTTNRRYYTHDQYLAYRGMVAPEQGITVAYLRVSGVAQKSDLGNQVKALEVYCDQHTIKVDEWMQDIGSGLNYKRKQFNRLMEMVELGQVRRIIIAHRDRLVRFGYGYFEAFCERHHTDLVVMNGEMLSPEQELVQDLLAVVTVFGARLHGLRSYKKAIKDAVLQKDQN